MHKRKFKQKGNIIIFKEIFCSICYKTKYNWFNLETMKSLWQKNEETNKPEIKVSI